MGQSFISVTNANGRFLAIDYFTPGPATQQDEVRNDKDIGFSIEPVLQNPQNSVVPYTGDFVTGDQFQMAIGNFDATPTSGTVSLEVGSTQTGLGTIPFNVPSATLQSAFNSALTTEAKPLCIVTELASGNYSITGATNGAITTGFFSVVSDALLYPVSDAFFVEGDLGSASTPYQLLFVMRQAPMCYAEATIEMVDADVAIETIQVGDATHNKIQRISFTVPQVYSGGYTVNATANSVTQTCGTGTPLMTATEFGQMLATHPEIKFAEQDGSADNIAVTVVGQSWVVEFIGTLANDDTNLLTVMNNPDGPLLGPKGCTGTINYNTIPLYIYSLAQQGPTFDLTRSITRTRASGERRTLYSGPVTIYKDLIDAQTALPPDLPSYYTTTQSDARFVKMVPGTSTMQNGSAQVFGSGSDLTIDAGASLASGGNFVISGAFNGTPSGGTADLSNVALTLPLSASQRPILYGIVESDETTINMNSSTPVSSSAASIILEPGEYFISTRELIGDSNAASAGTVSVIGFSGTWSVSGDSVDYGSVTTNDPTSAFLTYSTPAVTLTQSLSYPGRSQFLERSGKVVVTVAGTASIKTAQATPTMSDHTLFHGSYIIAERIS
jgi:hypothetical protein